MRKEMERRGETGIVLKKKKGKEERNLPPLFWKKDVFCKVTLLYGICFS